MFQSSTTRTYADPERPHECVLREEVLTKCGLSGCTSTRKLIRRCGNHEEIVEEKHQEDSADALKEALRMPFLDGRKATEV